jgi:hypothetical protein
LDEDQRRYKEQRIYKFFLVILHHPSFYLFAMLETQYSWNKSRYVGHSAPNRASPPDHPASYLPPCHLPHVGFDRIYVVKSVTSFFVRTNFGPKSFLGKVAVERRHEQRSLVHHATCNRHNPPFKVVHGQKKREPTCFLWPMLSCVDGDGRIRAGTWWRVVPVNTSSPSLTPFLCWAPPCHSR